MKPIAFVVAAGICLFAGISFAAQPTNAGTAALNHQLSAMPLAFTKNVGQWPDSILFRASARNTTLWLTRDGIYYEFTKRVPRSQTGEEALAAGLGLRQDHPEMLPAKLARRHDSIETTMIKAQFDGASPHAVAIGSDELTYTSNYFLGNDPSKWHTDVPNYSAVTIESLYPGIDITFRGDNGRLVCQYSSNDPATLSQVRVTYPGSQSVARNTDGTTTVQTAFGTQLFTGIMLGTGNSAPSLVQSAASPEGLTLAYSTYLGGGDWDEADGIAIDANGSAYVVGTPSSVDFPTLGPVQSDQPGNDVSITKLAPAGNSLVYSTYLGGSGDEFGASIAVDGQGCAYVTGQTGSTNFPTANAYQLDKPTEDGFVTKLTAAGNGLVYSTYLGGSGIDAGNGIAVDGSGCAYVVGWTWSTDFPTLTPFQTDKASLDGFLTKFSAAGNTLAYSTYLGGNGSEYAYDVAVDGSGQAYVVGFTSSTDYPTRWQYQSDQGGYDAFVTKMAATGIADVYSTYLGGSENDQGIDIAVDASGYAYVTGYTTSADFPTLSPYQTYQGIFPSSDIFVTKLSPVGNALAYSTYLGGTDMDDAEGIAVDNLGCAYVTGYTESGDYPTSSPLQLYQGLAAYADVIVTKLSAAGNSLEYSTYLGGSAADWGYEIAVDASGNAYVAGATNSTTFPTATPYQTDQANVDCFVTKLAFQGSCCTGTTGNVNMAGIVDLSDLSLLIAYLTTTPKPTLPCPAEANVNGVGIIDLSDLSLLIAYLTTTPKPTIPNCP